MKVEIWSDVMCPFCYIGKRNFETALKNFTEKEHIEVEWKSFQLDPSIPETALETYAEYLVKTKGMSPNQVQGMLQNVTESAKQVGLQYDFAASKMVNSHKAHQIIQLAKTKNLGDEAEERFFHAFFTEGKSISDPETLVELGKEIGLEEEEIQAALTDSSYEKMVNQDIQEARTIGVTGVPFFVFDRKNAISGAQPSAAFLETLEQSFNEWRAKNPNNSLEVKQGQSCTPDGKCE